MNATIKVLAVLAAAVVFAAMESAAMAQPNYYVVTTERPSVYVITTENGTVYVITPESPSVVSSFYRPETRQNIPNRGLTGTGVPSSTRPGFSLRGLTPATVGFAGVPVNGVRPVGITVGWPRH